MREKKSWSPFGPAGRRKPVVFPPQTGRTNRKCVRVATVAGYVLAVSLAAVVLALYYSFIWRPTSSPGPAQTGDRTRTGKPGHATLGTNLTDPEAGPGPGAARRTEKKNCLIDKDSIGSVVRHGSGPDHQPDKTLSDSQKLSQTPSIRSTGPSDSRTGPDVTSPALRTEPTEPTEQDPSNLPTHRNRAADTGWTEEDYSGSGTGSKE